MLPNDLPPPPKDLPPPPPGEENKAGEVKRVGKPPPNRPPPAPPLQTQATSTSSSTDAAHLARKSPSRQRSKQEVSEKVLEAAEKIDEKLEKPKVLHRIGVNRTKPATVSPGPQAPILEATTNAASDAGITKKIPPRPPRLHERESSDSKISSKSGSSHSPSSNLDIPEIKDQSKASSVDIPSIGRLQSVEFFPYKEVLPYTILFLTDLDFSESGNNKAAFEKAFADIHMIMDKKLYPRDLKEFNKINDNLERFEIALRKFKPEELNNFSTLKELYLKNALDFAKAIPLEKVQMPYPIKSESPHWQYVGNTLYLMALDQMRLIRLLPVKDRTEREIKLNAGIVNPNSLILAYKALGIKTDELIQTITQVLRFDDLGVKQQMAAFLLKWLQSGIYRTDVQNLAVSDPIRAIIDTNLFGPPDNPIARQYKFRLLEALTKNEPSLPAWKPTPIAKNLKPITEVFASIGSLFSSKAAYRELAKELTALCLDLLSGYPPSEIIDNDKKALAPNFTLIAARMENFTFMITRQIAQSPTLSKANEVFDFFVNVMKECLDIGNVQGALVVYQGLNDAAITRLNFKNSTFQDAKAIFSPMGSWVNLRNHCKAYKKGFIPCLQVLVKDITFSKDGNPDIVGDRMNGMKLELIANLINNHISNVITFIRNHPEIEHNLDLLDVLEGQGDSAKSRFDASLRLLPREPPKQT